MKPNRKNLIRYYIQHETVYAYSAPVAISHHTAYLTPSNSAQQTVERFNISVSPKPREITEHFDYFGNVRHQFSIIQAHDELRVSTAAQVQKLIRDLPTPDESPTCSEVYRFLKNPVTRDAVQASEFVFPTALTTPTTEIENFSKKYFSNDRSFLECVLDLNNAIYESFEFDPEATDINTPLDQFFKQKRGVCQDFAHFMVTCLRSQGYSAGYSSGYILTHPPEGQKRLEGADASHAWVTVFVPDMGWVDLDPTNNVMVNHEHIHVARGRDFHDLSPLKGAVSGGGEQKIEIKVTVKPEWEFFEDDSSGWLFSPKFQSRPDRG